MGNRERWLAAAALGLTACTGVSNDVENVPVATQSVAPVASGVSPVTTANEAVWTTVEVVDGDTIRVEGPAGEQTVRIIGINAPERGECFYDEATSALQFTLGDRELQLISDVSDVDQYGRLLRYVALPDGTDVGAELVKAGYARSHHYDPDVSRNAEYDELQSKAEQEGLGLWGPDACGAPVASGVEIAVDGQYDAPGDDNNNLNEEWVSFSNIGATPVDMKGWEVADESSSHRYVFKELTLEPGAEVKLLTGCGEDSETVRYWCNEDSAVWNNSGDTVFLKDPSGNVVVSKTYRE